VARKYPTLWFRPSILLGLLLFGELAIFLMFVLWESCFADSWQFLHHDAPKLETSNWLFLIGVISAITGWIVSSYITLRNSIKQHTITTLLQTRLSATYMERAQHINNNFFAPGMAPDALALSFLHDPANREHWHAIEYVLNYMEFLAVGVRHGDLDEKVLRHTMRGIVVRLYEKTRLLIEEPRQSSPKSREHLTWLYEKWKNK
jgi:hypothetical protein